MTPLEKLKARLELNDNSSDDLLSAYLADAAQKILNKLYPFESEIDVILPSKYESLQVDIADYWYLKRGAQGETIHNENGINRHYESADVPESMLREITPYAKVC